MKTIKVKDIKDAERLYSLIVDSVNKSQTIMVSFEDVDRLNLSFLSASLGRLYINFDHNKIDRLVKIGDCTIRHSKMIKKVIEHCKQPEVIRNKQLNNINNILEIE